MSEVCAVTGSSGYLGSVLITDLKNAGVNVLPLTRGGPYSFDLQGKMRPEFFIKNGITTLVHCAYDFSPRDWNEIKKINVEGSRNLLEAAVAGGVKNIIYISSMSAFDGCQSLYGRAKIETEAVVQSFGGKSIRPGLIYGKAPGGMVGTLINLVKASPIIPLIGNGNQTLYAVHENDLSRLILHFVQKPGIYLKKPLIAANPIGYTFREILAHFALNFRTRFFWIPVPWKIIWLILKTAEVMRLPIKMRSDSVVSLVNQDPSPDFSEQTIIELHFRDLKG